MQPQNSVASGSRAIQTMENFLSFLNSHFESWLSSGSTLFDIDPDSIFLSAAGMLLLYLWYLILSPFLPLLRKNQDTPKSRDRAKKGRRSLKGSTRFQRAQEERKLLSIVQRTSGKPYDPSCLRKILCPDPLCDVCNGATAKVSHLLYQSFFEYDASVSSTISTSSMTETSCTLSSSIPPNHPRHPIPHPRPESSSPSPSIFSTKKGTSSEGIVPSTSQDECLSSKSLPVSKTKFPLDHVPPHPLASFPPPPQHAAQDAELLLLPVATQTLVSSTSVSFTNVPTDKRISATDSQSKLARQQSEADIQSRSRLKKQINQELLDLPSSDAHLEEETSAYSTLPGNLSLRNSKDLALLKAQGRSKTNLRVSKDRESKTESFLEALRFWKKKSELAANPQNTPVSLSLERSKDKAQGLSTHPQPFHPQTSQDHLKPKHVQHFWGLPYLHSESIHSTTTVSTRCSSTCISFNRILTYPAALTHSTLLSLPESQSQTLTQPLTQSQSQIVPEKFQLQPQPPVPVLQPSPQAQLQICGLYFQRHQDEAQSLGPSAIHPLEYNIRNQERVWSLPTVVKESQEELYHPSSNLSLVREASKAHAPRTTSSGVFPLTSELRSKLEHHLQMRFILHRWGLPERMVKCPAGTNPHSEPTESSETRSSYGLSRASLSKQQDSKDLHNVVMNQASMVQERYSETFLLEEELRKAQGPSPETDSHLWSNTREVTQRQVPSTVSRIGPCPCPVTSPMGKEEQEVQGPFHNTDDHENNIYGRTSGTEPVLKQTPSVINTASLKESGEGQRRSPELPTRSTEIVSPQTSNTTQMLQEPSLFLVKGGQFCGLPAQSMTLHTSQYKSASGTGGNMMESENTAVTRRALKEMADSQTPDSTCQVSKDRDKQHIAVLGPRNGVPHSVDELNYKPGVTFDQSSPSRAMTAPHLEHTRGISVQQHQDPWVPPYVSGKWQNKDVPPMAKKTCPPACKTEELGAGQTGLGISRPNENKTSAQDRPSQGTHGQKPSPVLSRKVQTPELLLRNEVKKLLNFFNSEGKCKGQGVPRKGGLPTSPMQNPELLKGTAACPRNTVAQKTMRDAEKVNKERPGHRCATVDDACPKAPSSPQTNGRKSQQKKELQVQAERVQERHFPYQAFCPQAPNGNSSSLAAGFTSIKRWLGARDCQPQKGEAVQQKLPAQRHGLYMPQREPEPHQNLTFRSPAGQMPRAAAHLAVEAI